MLHIRQISHGYNIFKLFPHPISPSVDILPLASAKKGMAKVVLLRFVLHIFWSSSIWNKTFSSRLFMYEMNKARESGEERKRVLDENYEL